MDFDTSAKGGSPLRCQTICERCAPAPNNGSAAETLQGARCGRRSHKKRRAGGKGEKEKARQGAAEQQDTQNNRTPKGKTEAKARWAAQGAADKSGTPLTPPNKEEGIIPPALRLPLLKPASASAVGEVAAALFFLRKTFKKKLNAGGCKPTPQPRRLQRRRRKRR